MKSGSEGVDRMYFGMKNMNISYGGPDRNT